MVQVSKPEPVAPHWGKSRFKVWLWNGNHEDRHMSNENLRYLVLEWSGPVVDSFAEVLVTAVEGSDAAKYGRIISDSMSPAIKGIASSQTWKIISELWDECSQHHSLCSFGQLNRPRSTVHLDRLDRLTVPLPTRLVVADPERPRLVETQGKQGIYAALSHCWGDIQTLKTTRLNLEQHKEGIELSGVFPTFHDALVACKLLAIPYLWIDSLCIIQHDPADTLSSLDDFHRESQRMGQIYGNAELTIAATGASDLPTMGLFGGSDRHRLRQVVEVPLKLEPRRETRRRWRRRQRRRGGLESDDDLDSIEDYDEYDDDYYDEDDDDYSDDDDEQYGGSRYGRSNDDFIYVSVKPQNFAHEVLDSKLFTRGWVLQERVLSRRYLHFGREQWFWQCREATVAENSPFDSLASSYSSSWQKQPRGADLGMVQAISAGPGRFAEWWMDVVAIYSQLDFSVATDRLVALKGLMSEVQRLTRWSHAWGTWGDGFCAQLLWFPKHRTDDGDRAAGPIRGSGSSATGPGAAAAAKTSATSGRPSFRAPSWSWLSCPGEVGFPVLAPNSTVRHSGRGIAMPGGTVAVAAVKMAFRKFGANAHPVPSQTAGSGQDAAISTTTTPPPDRDLWTEHLVLQGVIKEIELSEIDSPSSISTAYQSNHRLGPLMALFYKQSPNRSTFKYQMHGPADGAPQPLDVGYGSLDADHVNDSGSSSLKQSSRSPVKGKCLLLSKNTVTEKGLDWRRDARTNPIPEVPGQVVSLNVLLVETLRTFNQGEVCCRIGLGIIGKQHVDYFDSERVSNVILV
ncbi:heterokaryon incompatibility protein-domain-containing protein [Xylariales sp. PMI_506]|nr:heterokaryon incompatibility protein-domain-containing protein [Xylariales sp. PMI_506]